MQASFTAPLTHGRGSLLAAAGTLALGLVLASLALGAFFLKAQRGMGQVRVVGAATVPFESDVVKWRVSLVRQVDPSDMAPGYTRLHEDVNVAVARLEEAGVSRGAVSVQPSAGSPVWGEHGVVTGYQLRQGFVVVSSSVAAVEALALNPASLLGEGVVLESSQLEYFYEDLPELKRSLLARATDDARARAAEIAERSEGRLGRMVTARAGVFQITEPYSTEVSGYGMYNTASRAKEMTVTVHTEFELR